MIEEQDLSVGERIRAINVPASIAIESREQQLYHRLLVMSHGDTALAERLIRYEANRASGRDRAELIDAAIERWVRDINR